MDWVENDSRRPGSRSNGRANSHPAPRKGRWSQAEIARLTRELARANKRLHTTEAALDIMGKAHALLETLSERADSDEQRKNR